MASCAAVKVCEGSTKIIMRQETRFILRFPFYFVVERESGSAERFQAAGVLYALSHAAVALAAGL